MLFLTRIIRKNAEQVIAYHDASGRSGIDNVLAVIAKVLASDGESGGLEMGDLIILLLRRVGSAIGSVLPELLQAMIQRIVQFFFEFYHLKVNYLKYVVIQ